MALSTLQYPPLFNPVRDPVWMEVTCGGYRVSAPVAGVFTLAVVQNPTDGQTWQMNVGGTEMEFTYVTSADDSGLQITIGTDTDATLANLLTALQGNYFMDQTFSMAIASGLLTMTARVPGALFVGFTNTSPVTMAFNEATPDDAGQFQVNYTANVQVWVEQVWGSGLYTAIPGLFGTPDADRRARWDLRESLLPYVGYDWPTYGATAASLQRAMQRKFYVSRYESYGDPPTPRRVDRGGIRRAWYAGSRNAEHQTIQEVFALMTRTDVLNPFMTYRGRGGARHEVSADQQHHLAWMRRVVKVADQQLYMRFTVYYTDNTTDTDDRHADVNASGWEQYDVKLFPTGFKKNSLHTLQPTKVPYKYTAQVLSHSAAALSEVHTFHLVDVDANEQHVEYISSFGVVESVRLVGAWSEGMTGNMEAVKRMLTVVNTVLPSTQQSNLVHQLKGAQRTRTMSTGFMDANELLAIVDLLVSPEHRLMDHGRSARTPLSLVGAEHVMRQQGVAGEHLYALNLEFLEGDAEMAWSNRIALQALPPVDPGGEA